MSNSESEEGPSKNMNDEAKSDCQDDRNGQTNKPTIRLEDITALRDHGILKQIITEGTGWERPPIGSKVCIHYVGKLTDGSIFESSRKSAEPFEFYLGKTDSVIKALHMCVSTMRKGELAEIKCNSKYAYEEEGKPPVVPPNETLRYQIELFNWSGEDISPNHDGSLIKETITEGRGNEKPNHGASVDVHLTGQYGSVTFDERNVIFNIGDGFEHDVVEGIELALLKFKEGETARLVITSNYAFKNNANNSFHIPSIATIEYTVRLNSFTKAKEHWEMKFDEKHEKAKQLKDKGTKYFEINQIELALSNYKRMVVLLRDVMKDNDLDESTTNECKQLLLSGYLNLALCCLKTGQNMEATYLCMYAIEIDDKNVKAYFRKGQAHMKLNQPEEALANFRQVLQLDPSNTAAQQQIILAQKRVADQNQNVKDVYKKMFKMDATKKDTQKHEEEHLNEVSK